MILVSVMYPGGEHATFDEAYYLGTHIPLVRKRWTPMGLEEVHLVKGTGTPDGSPPPYRVMALLRFRSLQDFRAAAGAHGAEIFADIPKFTNVQPILQINEPLGQKTPL
ncbi:EthD family reductase [Microvirga massiliensis]|uniref:EthD family reductase n=1 Tax=Microvirga massiliensis TaxID=1033741 RepID=UPI00062BC041|nr:EthD family reductase [Microvirga massiliensis]